MTEYADARTGTRKKIRSRAVFLAQGSSALLDGVDPVFRYPPWRDGIITCLQYRVYLERPAIAAAYDTLEMHYYRSPLSDHNIIAWMFPKRDHLSIGLGMGPKVNGAALRAELAWFLPRVQARLFPEVAYAVREEGNLLYGGKPRPGIGHDRVMVGGTAAGLVDATTGEGIYEAALSGRFAAAAVSADRRARKAIPHRRLRRRRNMRSTRACTIGRS